MLMISHAWAAQPSNVPDSSTNTGLALFALLIIAIAWVGVRNLIRSLRAGKAKSVVGADFADYAREVLVNAAKIDGRVSAEERTAVARAMADLAGAAYDEAKLAKAFGEARLSKDELVAYLAARSSAFSREQKTALLKALLSVFAADGNFDETEHAALVDYTAAVGFDRQGAPQMLGGLARDFTRGNIT
jgi:uncharacterized membrane protein YebE (DUF533 family)